MTEDPVLPASETRRRAGPTRRRLSRQERDTAGAAHTREVAARLDGVRAAEQAGSAEQIAAQADAAEQARERALGELAAATEGASALQAEARHADVCN